MVDLVGNVASITLDATANLATAEYFFTDFRDNSLANFAGQWDTDGVAWTVQSGTDSIYGKYLERTGTDASPWHGLSRLTELRDAEILVRFKPAVTVARTGILALIVRGQGTAGSETAYQFIVNRGSSGYNIRLSRIVSGTTTHFYSSDWTISSTRWTYIRFRVKDTSLQFKVWRCDAAEPGTWWTESTSSHITTPGWVGIATYDCGQSVKIGYVAIATHGGTAPIPAAESLALDFESADVGTLPAPFVSSASSSAAWSVSTDQAYAGTKSLKSGAITGSQFSAFEFTGWTADGSLSVYYRLNSDTYTSLYVEIDGAAVFDPDNFWDYFWYQDTAWHGASITLPDAGYHTIRFATYNSENAATNTEFAWIDNVSIPVPVVVESGTLLQPNGLSIDIDLTGRIVTWPAPTELQISLEASGALTTPIRLDASPASIEVSATAELITAITMSASPATVTFQAQARLTAFYARTAAPVAVSRRILAAVFTAEPQSGYCEIGTVMANGPSIQSARLVGLGQISRRLNESTPNLDITLDNSDGALTAAFSTPPLLQPVTVYAAYPTGAVFTGTVSRVALGPDIVLTLEG